MAALIYTTTGFNLWGNEMKVLYVVLLIFSYKTNSIEKLYFTSTSDCLLAKQSLEKTTSNWNTEYACVYNVEKENQ